MGFHVFQSLHFLVGFCKGNISAAKGSLGCTDFSYTGAHECPLSRENGTKAEHARLKTKLPRNFSGPDLKLWPCVTAVFCSCDNDIYLPLGFWELLSECLALTLWPNVFPGLNEFIFTMIFPHLLRNSFKREESLDISPAVCFFYCNLF